jgi:hypothetical protein
MEQLLHRTDNGEATKSPMFLMHDQQKKGHILPIVVGKLLLKSNGVALLPLLVKDTSYF